MSVTATTTAPAHFPGTPEEVSVNRATHSYDPEFGRCQYCDCRPWGIVAEWPCGTEPPRVEVPSLGDHYGPGTPFSGLR